ncbi:MAG: DUF4352 domain-containing protein [Acidimicrobiia bacterium]|nr:DUF4352 domain-containing protein [Acidimicrobiia bacterium]
MVLGVMVAVIVGLAVLAAVGERRSERDPATGPTAPGAVVPEADRPGDDPNPGALYPGRPGSQAEDQERAVGEPVRLAGYTATVRASSLLPTFVPAEDRTWVRVDVSLLNRDDRKQAYHPWQWQLQTPSGVVHNPRAYLGPMLGSGELLPGSSVEGAVYFEIGAERGDCYVLFKPELLDAARGVWRIVVPPAS